MCASLYKQRERCGITFDRTPRTAQPSLDLKGDRYSHLPFAKRMVPYGVVLRPCSKHALYLVQASLAQATEQGRPPAVLFVDAIQTLLKGGFLCLICSQVL